MPNLERNHNAMSISMFVILHLDVYYNRLALVTVVTHGLVFVLI